MKGTKIILSRLCIQTSISNRIKQYNAMNLGKNITALNTLFELEVVDNVVILSFPLGQRCFPLKETKFINLLTIPSFISVNIYLWKTRNAQQFNLKIKQGYQQKALLTNMKQLAQTTIIFKGTDIIIKSRCPRIS